MKTPSEDTIFRKVLLSSDSEEKLDFIPEDLAVLGSKIFYLEKEWVVKIIYKCTHQMPNFRKNIWNRYKIGDPSIPSSGLWWP